MSSSFVPVLLFLYNLKVFYHKQRLPIQMCSDNLMVPYLLLLHTLKTAISLSIKFPFSTLAKYANALTKGNNKII